MKRPRIVVVGSSNTDMVVASRRIPGPGETVTGGRFLMAAGGKGANQAVAAARLAAEVAFVARLGADLFGTQAIDGYQREGIDTQWIVRDQANHTGVALILVDDKGENSISVALGANDSMGAEDVERAAGAIAEADVLLLQLEVPMAAVSRAAALAAAAEVPVILDPAPAPDGPLPEDLLRHITYLTPNEHEATLLTGQAVHDEASARQAACRLLDAGVKNVLVTLGAKGVFMAGGGGEQFFPGVEVEAVDSTAAGDAFNGALGVALASGLELAAAVQLASAAGALAATRNGAQPSLAHRGELASFCSHRGIACPWGQ